MFARLRTFLDHHPALRDALRWAIPALLFGALLRLLFLSYLPYAYWGSDSRSYFNFAYTLIEKGYISLDDKRRFIYPLLMAPIAALPGAPLRWIAWLQHGLGLGTLIPLAYIVRKTCAGWRWWVVPITVLYTGMPVLLWYEHELLGETVFFGALLCAFAGWVAWIGEANAERARRLFWCFFVPFAVFILTKPSGRFVWPGVFAGIVLTGAWRVLQRRHYAALVALIFATLAVGSGQQGAWLLYTATFPLTRTDTALHADYKAEILKKVETLRADLHSYPDEETWAFEFLEKPSVKPGHPLWEKLERNDALRARVYMDLALEGIKANPAGFLQLGWQRLLASANPSEFKEKRFDPNYYVVRIERFYEEAGRKPSNATRFAFALGAGPLAPYADFGRRLSPAPDSWMARAVNAWVGAYMRGADLFRTPAMLSNSNTRSVRDARPTVLGCWLVAGLVLSLLPVYFRRVGVWTLIALSYLAGVFLFSQVNPRYFAPAWPVLIVLLAVPADAVFRTLRGKAAATSSAARR